MAYPDNTTVDVGNSLSFTCLVVGSPDLTVMWFKDGEIISTGIINLPLNDTLSNYTLVLNNVEIDDTGTYTCQAMNRFANLTASNRSDLYFFVQSEYTWTYACTQSLILLITGAPEVYPSQLIKRILNGTVNVAINFTIMNAVPSVSVEDIHPNFTRYDGLSSPFNFSQENPTFNIDVVDIYKSEGTYTVNATNQAGSSLGTIYLDVQSMNYNYYKLYSIPSFCSGPPVSFHFEVSGDVVFDVDRSAYISIETQSVIFTCTFLADPQPTVEWLLNGRVINTAQPSKYEFDSRYHLDLVSIGNMSEQLTILNVNMDDTGNYTCRGLNEYNSTEATHALVVLGQY